MEFGKKNVQPPKSCKFYNLLRNFKQVSGLQNGGATY